MVQVCARCSRVNPGDAVYCYFDGGLLEGRQRLADPHRPGNQPFSRPFVFPSGRACASFDQLACCCQDNWAEAVGMLRQGMLENFLGGLGRADLAMAARAAAGFPDSDRGLDQLLARLPTQALAAPKLHVESAEIKLGPLQVGRDARIQLRLANQGMRLIYGAVTSDCQWLAPGDGGNAQKLVQFQRETTIPVTVRGQHLRAGGKPLEGKLIVESNAGTAEVVVRAEVPVQPFAEGVLAGAVTPRHIAEKAMKSPAEAAPWFEQGAIARWYAANGWTYPVKGPSASGLGAVQQFFEALGLTRAPKVEISEAAVALRGRRGEEVRHALQVRTRENRPVYAYGVSDQPWLKVGRPILKGPVAHLPIHINPVPDRSCEVLQAKIRITANGNRASRSR
jgi:hypothetical protein